MACSTPHGISVKTISFFFFSSFTTNWKAVCSDEIQSNENRIQQKYTCFRWMPICWVREWTKKKKTNIKDLTQYFLKDCCTLLSVYLISHLSLRDYDVKKREEKKIEYYHRLKSLWAIILCLMKCAHYTCAHELCELWNVYD